MTGNKLKTEREKLGLSQQELATALCVSIQWVQANEQRGSGTIATGLADKLAHYIGKVAK